MRSGLRQGLIYAFVLVSVSYLSIMILSKSLHYQAKEVILSSAIPTSPSKPNVLLSDQDVTVHYLGDSEERSVAASPADSELLTSAPTLYLSERQISSPVMEVEASSAQVAPESAQTPASSLTTAKTDPHPFLKPDNLPKTNIATPVANTDTVTVAVSVPVETAQPRAYIAPKAHGWSVRVGTFADNRLAAKIMSELSDQGYIVFSQLVRNNAKKDMTAVFVGSENTRSDADDLRTELQHMENIAGQVVYLK